MITASFDSSWFMHLFIRLIQPPRSRFYSRSSDEKRVVDRYRRSPDFGFSSGFLAWWMWRTSARFTIPTTIEIPVPQIPLAKAKNRRHRFTTLILQAAGYSPSVRQEKEDKRFYRHGD
jgi:hypothetical protein